MIDLNDPKTFPKNWLFYGSWGESLIFLYGKLRVIIDCEFKEDGNKWMHVSASTKNYLPTHYDMQKIKNDFIGEDYYAYSIWPPKSEYVNIHPHTLHLWAIINDMNGKILPEFSGKIGDIKSI